MPGRPIHPFIHPFIPPFIFSYMPSITFILSFVHSFIHSFVRLHLKPEPWINYIRFLPSFFLSFSSLISDLSARAIDTLRACQVAQIELAAQNSALFLSQQSVFMCMTSCLHALDAFLHSCIHSLTHSFFTCRADTHVSHEKPEQRSSSPTSTKLQGDAKLFTPPFLRSIEHSRTSLMATRWSVKMEWDLLD